ncbi:MAG: hypothetical protein IKB98_07495 [Clostridia bacterium]|nr:hypothetical protein [Clostridia bacterium]
MGLDMYLLRKNKKSANVCEVGYWRKANSIHRWIVEHCTENGKIEDCEEIPISKDSILHLKDEAITALVDFQNGNIDGVKEKFRPMAGFFFGSMEYDEYFADDLTDTISICADVLKNTNFEEEELIYYAWW